MKEFEVLNCIVLPDPNIDDGLVEIKNGEKFYWKHPDRFNREVYEINEEQSERIIKHGCGPFVLKGVKDFGSCKKLCFEDVLGEDVEIDSIYFVA